MSQGVTSKRHKNTLPSFDSSDNSDDESQINLTTVTQLGGLTSTEPPETPGPSKTLTMQNQPIASMDSQQTIPKDSQQANLIDQPLKLKNMGFRVLGKSITILTRLLLDLLTLPNTFKGGGGNHPPPSENCVFLCNGTSNEHETSL